MDKESEIKKQIKDLKKAMKKKDQQIRNKLDKKRKRKNNANRA